MTRVKRGMISKKKHRKLKKMTRGYKLSGRALVKVGRQRVLKAGARAYSDRKKKKRVFRSLWIIRLNAALRENGMTYSKFINTLKKKNIELDRKILAKLAAEHPEAFKALVKEVAS